MTHRKDSAFSSQDARIGVPLLLRLKTLVSLSFRQVSRQSIRYRLSQDCG